VFDQLQSFLNRNCISEIFQSDFKSAHSTETALLRVLNDILLATDSGDSVDLLDTQIYLPNNRNDPPALSTILRCLDEVKIWLAQKMLRLNEDKTEVIVFSPTDHSQATNLDLGSLSAFRSSRV